MDDVTAKRNRLKPLLRGNVKRDNMGRETRSGETAERANGEGRQRRRAQNRACPPSPSGTNSSCSTVSPA